MKSRSNPVGQYILDGLGDTDDDYKFLDELLPLIGEVIILFNALESDLDHLLCEAISDSSDQRGLMVLHNMKYLSKVELYERFTDDRLRLFEWNGDGYAELIPLLKQCGMLRNRVVHAHWHYTDQEGFTQVRIKIGKIGLEHELWQFSAESMHDILKTIERARNAIESFEEECSNRLADWNNEMAQRGKQRGQDS